jgi:glycosyltransferase involved in cell wall biosynthesis
MSLKDERKGFIYLRDSLKILYDNYPELRTKVEVIVFGASKKRQTIDISFKTNFLGRISDVEKLVACYNSADVFAAPSLEDNLPNTVMESLACGTPVVAFNIGGMPDMIDHKGNGFLVNEINADKLKTAIKWILDIDEILKKTISYNARKKVVDNFNRTKIANSYLKLYQELLSSQ